MIKLAGWIMTLAGLGHTVGSLVETAPDQGRDWFNGDVWGQSDYTAWNDAAAGFWYTAFSFGPPLLLMGATVLWLERRGVTPPPFIAVAMACWVVLTFAASGPSPLLLLLIASALLLLGARRARHLSLEDETLATTG